MSRTEAELIQDPEIEDFRNLEDMRRYVAVLGPKSVASVCLRLRAPKWIWVYQVQDNLIGHPGEYRPNTRTLDQLLNDANLFPMHGWSAYVSLTENQRSLIDHLVGKV